ncbi:hypothetical protein ACNOYE_12930 [Nannocystaceae bacterium ST9]
MAPRFDHDARDAATTLDYFRNRAVQFLHDDMDWTWSGVVTPLVHEGVEWGSETRLRDREGHAFVSVYVYAGRRGQGHLRRHAAARPPGLRYLTSPGCGIYDALAHLDPSTVLGSPISGWPEYLAIERHYGEGRAARSGLPYMNHIDEGLRVLHRWLGAPERAMRAWCLHPLVQSDDDLRRSYAAGLLDDFAPAVVALALEYRNIANAFLSPMESHPGYTDPTTIARSPLAEIDAMLVADKLQNCKDFRLHHRDSHPRADWLARYFDQWLAALGVEPSEVDRLTRETAIPAGSIAR